MRTLVVLALLLGLAPGLGEVAESVAHLAVDGHLAHSEADRGDHGDPGREHGCGTTEHHCLCCSSQPVAPPGGGLLVQSSDVVSRLQVEPRGLASLDAPAPPLRPPIAS